MLLKSIAFTLIYSTLSYSETDFSNKFCDNSSMNQMIDRVFQTPTTIYVIRNSLVYPIIRKEMPLIVGQNHFWTQNRDAFHIRHLFIGNDLTDFETGFTITLDQNKNFIRDFQHKPSYYYLTFIFSGQNYYLFKELSNNSFVLANSEDIPLKVENQGSIKEVFGIEAPIYGCDYKILKTSFDPDFIFVALLLSNDNMFYSYVLHKTGEQTTELKAKTDGQTIDQNYKKYSAQNIRGIVRTNVPYIVLDNSLIELLHMQNLGRSQRLSIWEAFDCDYFTDYLPQIEELNDSGITWSTTESTITIKPKQTSSYWVTIIVLTIIFLCFGFVIFFPLLAFRNIRKNLNQTYLSKDDRKALKDKLQV